MGQGHAGGNDTLFVILNNIAAEFMATRTPEQARAIETKSDRWYEQAEEAFVQCRLRIKPLAVRLREERTKAYDKHMDERSEYLESSPCSTRPKVAAFHKALSEYGRRGAEAAKKSRSKAR
jgi:hypothetical protein